MEANEFRSSAATEVHIASIANPSKYSELTMTRKLMPILIEITDHKFDDAARTFHQEIVIAQKWHHAVMVGTARMRRERKTKLTRRGGMVNLADRIGGGFTRL